jgi:putative ABC transport system permease protein
MLQHVFKLMWHKKRQHALLITEIAVAFMVVFGLCVAMIGSWRLYHEPLGFEYADTWSVNIQIGGEWDEENIARIPQVLQAARELQDVQWAHVLWGPPFVSYRWISTAHGSDGRSISSMFNYANDGALADIGVRLIDGRWFGPEDEGLDHDVVVVSRRFQQELFPDSSPLGANVRDLSDIEDGEERRELRIVGVFEEFRQMGEFSDLSPYAFERYSLTSLEEYGINLLAIKVRPGTTAEFEEELLNRLRGVAKTWEFEVTPWAEQRDASIRDYLLPLTIMAIIGVFLMIMVAFGLFGVLWQNVTRRTQEIGLRRAMGATQAAIQSQIIAELLIVSLLGIAIGLIIAVQFPMLDVATMFSWSNSIYGGLAAIGIILGMSALCAWYPSRVATRFSPAMALHYE